MKDHELTRTSLVMLLISIAGLIYQLAVIAQSDRIVVWLFSFGLGWAVTDIARAIDRSLRHQREDYRALLERDGW